MTDPNKSNDTQPKLKPVKKEFADMTRKLNEAGKKAVEEMMKQPLTLEEVAEQFRRLKAERLKNKQ